MGIIKTGLFNKILHGCRIRYGYGIYYLHFIKGFRDLELTLDPMQAEELANDMLAWAKTQAELENKEYFKG